jgi:hypothetical protein
VREGGGRDGEQQQHAGLAATDQQQRAMMQQLQPLPLLSQCPPPRAAAAMDGGHGGAVASEHHCAVYCWRIPSNMLWTGVDSSPVAVEGRQGRQVGAVERESIDIAGDIVVVLLTPT